MSNNDAARLADAYAAQAAQTAAKLKPGTWESVQALATLSIAQSLLSRTSSGDQ
ncbi:hypothetical protein [Agromyces sp. SYSU T00194]|uniref:hypothetical protein n=1 Tax=Agromyces chitinivorans TaxID=3158560 RepID=UPI0033947B35